MARAEAVAGVGWKVIKEHAKMVGSFLRIPITYDSHVSSHRSSLSVL